MCSLIFAEEFSVVHQSTSKSFISDSEVATLYCVASKHSLGFKYTWENDHGVVGVNSPVVFANKTGVYRCTVTNATGDKCFSKNIVVSKTGMKDLK